MRINSNLNKHSNNRNNWNKVASIGSAPSPRQSYNCRGLHRQAARAKGANPGDLTKPLRRAALAVSSAAGLRATFGGQGAGKKID